MDCRKHMACFSIIPMAKQTINFAYGIFKAFEKPTKDALRLGILVCREAERFGWRWALLVQ